jgi:TPR repeat protein
VEYFEKASKQGYVTAQCNLAMMYASGKGVFPNFGRAHVFAKTGVEQGNPICKKVWEDYNLSKYPEDKSFKLNFYTKP